MYSWFSVFPVLRWPAKLPWGCVCEGTREDICIVPVCFCTVALQGYLTESTKSAPTVLEVPAQQRCLGKELQLLRAGRALGPPLEAWKTGHLQGKEGSELVMEAQRDTWCRVVDYVSSPQSAHGRKLFYCLSEFLRSWASGLHFCRWVLFVVP